MMCFLGKKHSVAIYHSVAKQKRQKKESRRTYVLQLSTEKKWWSPTLPHCIAFDYFITTFFPFNMYTPFFAVL